MKKLLVTMMLGASTLLMAATVYEAPATGGTTYGDGASAVTERSLTGTGSDALNLFPGTGESSAPTMTVSSMRPPVEPPMPEEPSTSGQPLPGAIAAVAIGAAAFIARRKARQSREA